MLKILIFLAGLSAGAAGAIAWLLGLPGLQASASVANQAAGNPLGDRIARALAEGKQAKTEAEAGARRALDADRAAPLAGTNRAR